MKIVIAAVASSAHLSGVSRHAANLARCLLGRPEVVEIHLLVASWQYSSMYNATLSADSRLQIHSVELDGGAIRRNLWYYNSLPRLATQLDADIVHLAYPAPLRRKAYRCPTVVTLHDLYPYDIPANFGPLKVFFNQLILQQCLRTADAIACVSESTRRRLQMFTSPGVVGKSLTIYNCVELGTPTAVESPLPAWDGGPFLLCVAQHRRNKNIMLAMKVFLRLLGGGDVSPTARLVIVGIEGPETERLQSFIRSAGIGRQVILLRGISEAELQWCYGHCEFLLAPSTVEGFGLPIVEAMLHRCRIVCSDIPVFREIGGAYCHYASLKEPAEDAFVDAARCALQSIKLRGSTTHQFSAANVAEACLQLYTRLRLPYPIRQLSQSRAVISSLERGRS